MFRAPRRKSGTSTASSAKGCIRPEVSRQALVSIKLFYSACQLLFSLLLLTALAGRCQDGSGPKLSNFIQVEAWPEADKLFHSNSNWLGGDDAYSIDLGDQRVLWLFGDSFIATSSSHTRKQSVLVNNSVAIESGYDPSHASIQFYWRTQNGKPLSFFPGNQGTWYWPGHGIVVRDKLFIFLITVRETHEGLGFELTGWTIVAVPNFRSPPSQWELRFVQTPASKFHFFPSGPILRASDFIYAFSYQDPGFNISLVRWPVADVENEDFSRPEWWNGKAGWVLQKDLGQAPAKLAGDGQAEFTVSYQPDLKQFLMIQVDGAGRADIAFRRADALTGPWTPLQAFYRPTEYQIPDIMIYAAKAHPELRGSQLVLTYATNKFKLQEVLATPDLYYPRFLKASVNPKPQSHD